MEPIKEIGKNGYKRLWRRRWAKVCDACGTPIVFLDNPEPIVEGKKRPAFKAVELYGERDGVLMPWNGEIAFDRRVHVEHKPNCSAHKRRVAWLIRRDAEDL